MKKLKIAVLMGGRSAEHEISLISGAEVFKNIDTQKYFPFKVVIPKSGLRFSHIRQFVKADVVFIALHGSFGEDGTIQGLLDTLNIPYTSPGVLASSIGMNKLIFKSLLTVNKISTPKFVSITKNEPVSKIHSILGNPPYFVKPHNQGSSVGCSIIKTKTDINKALKKAYKFSQYALIEEYIQGSEITCAVLGNNNPQALPLIEIRPLKGDYFDYKSKYEQGGADEIVPARIPKKLTEQIQKIALDVYELFNCKGFSRVDFILKNNSEPMVLEINTIPGLTPMSLFPKAAMSAGISYSMLIDKIIKYARK